MRYVKISEKLAVMGQPDPAEFKDLTADGFSTIINNRPDGEEPVQPGSAVEAEAALRAGLGYAHIPVSSPSITEADVRKFQSVVDAADGTVLAHCKGGTRSLTLHVLGEVLDGRMPASSVAAFGETHGFNLTGAVAWLKARGIGA